LLDIANNNMRVLTSGGKERRIPIKTS
jgi:hypothetical protein